MVKRASTKRKASFPTPSNNISTPTTRSAALQQQAPASLACKKTKTSTKTTEGAVMFGKSKKNRPFNGQSTSSASNNNIREMFLSIAEDPDDPNSVINLEGIAKLGERLGIDVTEDVRILVLLWKMDCKDKPGSITLAEWTNGCEVLGVDSFDALASLLPSFDLGFLENTTFKDFYKFCFKFNLTGTHRTLPKELVIELLQLVMTDRDPYDRVGAFCNFLQQTDNTYSCITMDQWCSFFDFTIEVGNDVSNYDESTSAWPVLIDEFVDFLAKQQSS